MFAGVDTVGDAEAQVKVKGFEQQVSEEVPLDQPEAAHLLTAHTELQPGTQGGATVLGNITQESDYVTYYYSLKDNSSQRNVPNFVVI